MSLQFSETIILDGSLDGLLRDKSLLDHLDSAVAVFDARGTLRYANRAFSGFNKSVRDSVARFGQDAELLDSPELRAWLNGVLSSGKAELLRQTFYYAPLIQVDLTLRARPVVTPDNELLGVMLTLGEESIEFDRRHVARAQEDLRKLSERVKVLDQGRRSNDKLIRVLSQHAPFAMIVFNRQRQIVQINRAAEKMFDAPASVLIGQTCESVLSCYEQCGSCPAMDLGRDIQEDEVEGRTNRHRVIPILRSLSRVHDDAGEHLVVEAFIDLTERNKAEEQIHNLAFYDSLTRLPNRRLLIDRLHQAIATSTRNREHAALLFMDLDHFKVLNDTRGHDIGDLLLIEVAKRLRDCVREDDTVARFGGDEFVIILEALSPVQDEAIAQVEKVAEKILARINEPVSLESHEYRCSSSIGINLFYDHEHTVDELLKQADVAMYQSKGSGRNMIRFFDPVMQATLDARSKLEVALRQAVEQGEFQLHYQIQVDTGSKPIGAEALLRWSHPAEGIISPVRFIPLAEENGMILPIGQWVLENACEQIRRWQAKPSLRELSVSVNVSVRQFRQENFVEQVKAALEKSAINPRLLTLELTESMFLDNVEATIVKMHQLKTLGVSFSIDDFGTGYSSLFYLKRLPIDQIKIDQVFVQDVNTDPNDAAIVHTIIAMADNLGLEVIAEGVETEDQRKTLELHGCTGFQGYLFSKPIPVKELELLLGGGG